MIRLSEERSRALAEVLPAGALSFLRDNGVPELADFRLIKHVFTLDMEPLFDGAFYRLGSVDGGYAMGLQRTTGYFGYVFAPPDQPPWVFCNSSIQCFLLCFAASERLWGLVQSKQLAEKSRGDWLEQEIRKIDPAVFADENNIWSFLVEELQAGVV